MFLPKPPKKFLTTTVANTLPTMITKYGVYTGIVNAKIIAVTQE